MKEKPKPLVLEIYEEVNGAREEIIDLFYSNKKVDEKDIRRVFWHLKKNVIEDIKSACEFYLRYKDNPELLIKNFPEYKIELAKIGLEELEIIQLRYSQFKHPRIFIGMPEGAYINLKQVSEYNEWLFKLAFKDVLEK